MKLLYNHITYYIISIFLLISLLTNTYILPQKRYLINNDKYKISYYGIFVGISLFLFLNYIIKCNIEFTNLIIFFIVGLFFMYINCSTCNKSYQYIAFYKFFLPLMPLFFNCNNISSLLTSISIAAAIGRLGCISAGCCYGKILNKCQDSSFHLNYPDKNQIINIRNNNKNTCAFASTLIEAIIQFIIAGLCLQFPNKSVIIYCISNAFLVFLTSVIRSNESDTSDQRRSPKLTYVSFAILILYCGISNNLSKCNNNKYNYIYIILFALMIVFAVSNDINLNYFNNIL